MWWAVLYFVQCPLRQDESVWRVNALTIRSHTRHMIVRWALMEEDFNLSSTLIQTFVFVSYSVDYTVDTVCYSVLQCVLQSIAVY